MNKITWLFAAAAAALTTAGSAMDNTKNPGIAPARDGNIAIQEEFCAARQAGTVAAYDLFLARHPGHLLAEQAKSERAAILRRNPAP
ncbi:MAG: hypothetical protein H0W74_10245 [Sphingosinicella sp.]|nr:hypothetical protein [Sphingosinicella sp.]